MSLTVEQLSMLLEGIDWRMAGISRSQISQLCEEIDGRVPTFLNRALEGDWPYVWLDATRLREGGCLAAKPVRRLTADADEISAAELCRSNSILRRSRSSGQSSGRRSTECRLRHGVADSSAR